MDGRRERTMEAVCFLDEMKAAEQSWEVERRPAPPSLMGRKAWPRAGSLRGRPRMRCRQESWRASKSM